jgi:hypothetical protein
LSVPSFQKAPKKCNSCIFRDNILGASRLKQFNKELILNVFDKISQDSMMMLEIFVNYDCDIAQKDITKNIVESLSKIANGKFKQTEHQSIISVQEEPILRRHST